MREHKEIVRIVAFIALFLFSQTGCAHHLVNDRLAEYQPDAGYRFKNLTDDGNSDALFVAVAFSGGGTRAAALSYGVMKALSETEIAWQGKTKRLVEEIDLISTISGGSFTGGYYALFGDRIFTDFERKFLKRDIEGELTGLLRRPTNWFRLASFHFDRIDLAAEHYHRTVFEEKTFGDLLARNRRPFVVINATNMSLGDRFEFTQDQFDFLGSDLSSYPVARAVAASSAFPFLLSPITLNNHPAPSNYRTPPWVENAMEDYELNRRRFMRAKMLKTYEDKDGHPYTHLLDGGLADNIGLRHVIDSVRDGGIRQMMNQEKIEKFVAVIVNAKTSPPQEIDQKEDAPHLLDVAVKTATISMDNYSFETIELMKDVKEAREQAQRAIEDCQGLLAESCPLAPRLPALKQMDFYIIEVSFESIDDPKEREWFLSLPTNFSLKPAVVDRLIEKGGALLKNSEEFQRLIEELPQ
ncbi:patatin-like phospholipase family protein [Candidatus Manganitrophus noduliformans]|uniref:Patatin-like phospholipase family protein n=1 Tax=Candidatus Manganitrophus noduliformans TaxID=2606439 RepID=A0A7X6DU04_9BACT|nr:patatin-like phospholipase family protein [Candidatus Manganitrophus noduliformans]NKE73008.1 patatin-like phospholipase family protein [Candidatus Manganitrophus noduliformans]